MYDMHGNAAFNMVFRKQVYRNLGACLSPHNAFLQSLGLDTLDLRTERSGANAMAIAQWLEKNPRIQKVHYPGLPSSPFYKVATEQFGNEPCSLLTFDLGSKEECFRMMNCLKVIRRSTNLQDNKTLIIHPSSTIFVEYPEDQKLSMGLRDTMIRLSVGIEDVEDLIGDLDQALAC
jgi:O-acetylhomoserine (thiol)-lyase